MFSLCMFQASPTALMVTDVLKLRVILNDVNTERLILAFRPETVHALISETVYMREGKLSS